MIRKYMFIVIAAALLPMCSSKPTEAPKEEPKADSKQAEPKTEPKVEEKIESAPQSEDKAPAEPNTNWSAEIDELVEKTKGLAALADVKKCVKSHEALVKYMDTHQARLEELATSVTKLRHTVPPKDRADYEKKLEKDYKKQIAESLEKMSQFATLCCNKELKTEEAWDLENKLKFIPILKTTPK